MLTHVEIAAYLTFDLVNENDSSLLSEAQKEFLDKLGAMYKDLRP